ncbi:Isoflavone 2'-hydroxylase [Triticum urartu]|uniref:Isoflavone 2'-hydroxylase n=1 Tax=Triticum urartu TaxID=4572 RepID=M7ZXG2_TRIUA|nr:Isoflavone 2'-hydroxylase [Triticum urartu]
MRRIQEIVEETFAVSGAPNIGDFFPALRWVDRLRGVEAALVNLQTRRDAFVSALIDDHRRTRNAGGRYIEKKGVIDVLTEHQEADPGYYTDTVVKGIVLVLLTAGTDTSALTTEWAMALLVKHPECVVKETLRLCPVGPIIPAHEAMEDCTIWDAPEEFRPERLLDRDAVTTPMLPFGLGRRRCPGEALAMRLFSLTMAALVQCFEWDVGEGDTIDMAEGGGLTMPMATPLATVCRPREFVKSVLSAST